MRMLNDFRSGKVTQTWDYYILYCRLTGFNPQDTDSAIYHSTLSRRQVARNMRRHCLLLSHWVCSKPRHCF